MLEVFLLDGSADSLAKFSWYLQNGWEVVDRFEHIGNGTVLMMKKI